MKFKVRIPDPEMTVIVVVGFVAMFAVMIYLATR